MSTPQVQDRLGNRLEVGDRVRSQNWGDGEMTGFSTFTYNAEGMTVFAFLDGEEMPRHAVPTADPNVFRCQDLTRINEREGDDGN